MDPFVVTAAHHEAGHALMAYLFGWSIDYIKLEFAKNGEFQHGVTRYNEENAFNLEVRILCLIAGPVAQAIYEQNNIIDLNHLGPDGKSIDTLCMAMTSVQKNQLLERLFEGASMLLRQNNLRSAREAIVSKLILAKYMHWDSFSQICKDHNISVL